MWSMKVSIEGEGTEKGMKLGACSTNWHDSIADCVAKAKARAKALASLYHL